MYRAFGFRFTNPVFSVAFIVLLAIGIVVYHKAIEISIRITCTLIPKPGGFWSGDADAVGSNVMNLSFDTLDSNTYNARTREVCYAEKINHNSR